MDNITMDVSTKKNGLRSTQKLSSPTPRSPATERVEILLEQYKASQ